MSSIAPSSSGRDAGAAALEVVSQIDLSAINRKLQYENPIQWTDKAIAETEAKYRRFLALTLLHPSIPLSVNAVLDEYWHQHILHTRKYAADCEKVFGYFLHHYPDFGIEHEEDQQQNVEQFAVTQRLWEEAFGTPLVDGSRLTLDRIVGGYEPEAEGITRPHVEAYPQACKNCEHSNITRIPTRIPATSVPTPPTPRPPTTPR